MSRGVLIGTAGWSIPGLCRADFPDAGSHLERYGAVFDAAEINSSFYRPHRRATYERWAASVPPGFRFAVKLPKAITHERRLVDSRPLLDRFSEESRGLGEKLGAVLVQLPPSLIFDPAVTGSFFEELHATIGAQIACEPRHPSWFTPTAEAMLAESRIARVAADPAPAPGGGQPGGWNGLRYFRLHGSPIVYRSPYERARLLAYASTITAGRDDAAAWCIFDNTAGMAATRDALTLRAMVDHPRH